MFYGRIDLTMDMALALLDWAELKRKKVKKKKTHTKKKKKTHEDYKWSCLVCGGVGYGGVHKQPV